MLLSLKQRIYHQFQRISAHLRHNTSREKLPFLSSSGGRMWNTVIERFYFFIMIKFLSILFISSETIFIIHSEVTCVFDDVEKKGFATYRIFGESSNRKHDLFNLINEYFPVNESRKDFRFILNYLFCVLPSDICCELEKCPYFVLIKQIGIDCTVYQ